MLWDASLNKGYAITLYVEALVAPATINTMPDKTLPAFADSSTFVTTRAGDPSTCVPSAAFSSQ